MTTTDEGLTHTGADEPDRDDYGPEAGAADRIHFGVGSDEPWPDDVPRGQDDSRWRFQDDPRGARRAELRIAGCWALTLLAGVGLAIVYCVGGQPQAEGAMLAVGFCGLGTGLILWARDLLPGHEVTASRGHHHASSTDEERQAVVDSVMRTTEPIARRPFLGKMLGLVGGVFGLAALFPIASLGKRPHTVLYHSGWTAGARVVTEDGRPLRPGDVSANGILTVFPENLVTADAGGPEQTPQAAQSATVLINVGTANFKVLPGRRGWNINGLVAFSKICTHAGCPVGLYESQSHQLVCPCHQSTFDVLDDCKPVFGPASRSLPQLPLAVNNDGYLIARSDYHQAVGPGFWNRG